MLKSLRYKFNRNLIAHEHLMHAIIICTTFIVFFLFDFLTKYFLFTFDTSQQNIGVSYGLFGIRSYPHANTTLISFLKIPINTLFLGIFAILIATILLIVAIKVKRKLIVFFLIVILTGIIGNGIDFLRFGYVLDIIYLPWFDRGTFNIADCLIIVGAIGLALTIIFTQFIRESQNEKII